MVIRQPVNQESGMKNQASEIGNLENQEWGVRNPSSSARRGDCLPDFLVVNMAPEFVVLGIVSGSSVGMIVNDFDALLCLPHPLFLLLFFLYFILFYFLFFCTWRRRQMDVHGGLMKCQSSHRNRIADWLCESRCSSWSDEDPLHQVGSTPKQFNWASK